MDSERELRKKSLGDEFVEGILLILFAMGYAAPEIKFFPPPILPTQRAQYDRLNLRNITRILLIISIFRETNFISLYFFLAVEIVNYCLLY